jgi:hypothetical protein
MARMWRESFERNIRPLFIASFTTINLLNIWLRLTFENTHKTRGEEDDKT